MCVLPRQDQPGRPHHTGPPRTGHSASSDRGRPTSLFSDPAATYPAPDLCGSPPHAVPPVFPPCHHGLQVSLAPVIRETAALAFLPGLLLVRADPSLHLSRESAKPIPSISTDGGMLVRPGRTRGWMGGDGNRAGEGLPGATRNLGGAPTNRREARLSGGAGIRAS